MTTAELIDKMIAQMAIERVFSLSDLGLTAETYERARVKLSRLVQQGVLKKVGKGRFYKPRQSIFGDLLPNVEELVSDYLIKNGETTGYLTGYAAWHRMGLTTQVPNIIEIGTNRRRNKLVRLHYTVKFVLQPNKITRENIPLLQILDAMKSIKQIPDTQPQITFERIMGMIKLLNERQVRQITKLAENYSPSTRALLGVILEMLNYDKESRTLHATLNPATTYKIGLAHSTLANLKNWNIE